MSQNANPLTAKEQNEEQKTRRAASPDRFHRILAALRNRYCPANVTVVRVWSIENGIIGLEVKQRLAAVPDVAGEDDTLQASVCLRDFTDNSPFLERTRLPTPERRWPMTYTRRKPRFSHHQVSPFEPTDLAETKQSQPNFSAGPCRFCAAVCGFSAGFPRLYPNTNRFFITPRPKIRFGIPLTPEVGRRLVTRDQISTRQISGSPLPLRPSFDHREGPRSPCLRPVTTARKPRRPHTASLPLDTCLDNTYSPLQCGPSKRVIFERCGSK